MKSLKEKPKSVSEFQSYIELLYGDSNRKRPAEYLYAYLFRNAAYLSRVVGEKNEAKQNFIKTLSWLLAIANLLKIDVQNSFLKKYPDICPYCLVKPCDCIKTGKKPVAYIPEWKASEEIMHRYRIASSASPRLTLDEAVIRVNDLYPANKHIWNATGPTYQFFRILEELGEVHEAYTGYLSGNRSKENIEEELADVFAWLVSTWGIIYPRLSLGDEFIGYYYRGCPVCQQDKCSCQDHSDRGERLVEIDQLMKLKEKLEELLKVAPEYKESLDNIVASLDVVAKTKSTSGAVRTVNQAKQVLEDISSSVDSVGNIASKAKPIVHTIIEMAKTFGWM